ncbi:MAG: ferredoxin--NADP(+) reductase [Alphaproteobacteria bacterium CG_4_10_14_0_8_um_filter_53_9]|nr:MAG: ferredoxin--NADP(+) reductase [Alphaproteobacteria bacterium CG_4_10_14_0_8_um_filter_53_9]
MTDITTDIAIIGAGPAGLFMVFEAGFLGYSSTVIDALPQAGGQLSALYPDKPIYDIPGYPKILAGDLVAKLQGQAAPYKPTYVLGEPVLTLTGVAGDLTLKTENHTIQAKAVVIAGGGGMFTPRKPVGLDNLENFEDAGSVLYAITHKEALRGHTVVLAGGGDSAVDWAVELAGIAAHVHVVHRRADFRAAPETVRQMMALVDTGKITLHTPAQLKALHGDDGALASLTLADVDGAETEIVASKLICCFGIAPQKGPFAAWGVTEEKGKLPVDPSTMMTNVPGILAIGDIADYGHKLHLILQGFAEAAVAAKTLQALIDPDKKFKVQYSTSKGVPEV